MKKSVTDRRDWICWVSMLRCKSWWYCSVNSWCQKKIDEPNLVTYATVFYSWIWYRWETQKTFHIFLWQCNSIKAIKNALDIENLVWFLKYVKIMIFPAKFLSMNVWIFIWNTEKRTSRISVWRGYLWLILYSWVISQSQRNNLS